MPVLLHVTYRVDLSICLKLGIHRTLLKLLQLKWLKRVATVKDDGTVQFNVPGDFKPQTLDFGTGVVYDGTVDVECRDAPKVEGMHVPPLEIVMLIVGTRGDVQPFIAIGKRLQVMYMK